MRGFIILCVIYLLVIDGMAQFQTTLYPAPPTLEVCPRENYILSCTENATTYILWNWNDIIMRDYTFGFDNNINTTDLLLSNDNMMVSTRLISINSSHVHSQLKFTLLENVTSVQVLCNRVMLLVKVRDCSFTPVKFTIIKNDTNIYSSSIRIKWSNSLKINSTYYVNTSILSDNSMNTVFTNNVYVDLMMRPGVLYTLHVSTYCCKKLNEIGSFQITLWKNSSISIVGDTSYEIKSIKENSSNNEEEHMTTDMFLHHTSNICKSYETVIMPIGSVIIILLIVLNIALVIEIIRIRKTSCTFNKSEDQMQVECQINQEVPLYEQVISDGEVTAIVANSAYGIQQRKLN